ncbi:MAG: hypothetical protein Hyperionvirus2_169 [Hyperionvirus sp.]|uniref:Uncharacterized protein n=1 Tax=Hyperionvirus sp. TaxID=2487770 RepID=A0A3G5A9D8_9VIRU|nr:MAG: hypothetical protein Hyperionvirus2_169 [Hyperionvirus sp.]
MTPDKIDAKLELSSGAYNSLKLNILIDSDGGFLSETDHKALKGMIIELLLKKSDFSVVYNYYKAQGKESVVYDNITIMLFNNNSPMHDRHAKSGKKIYILKEMDPKYDLLAQKLIYKITD